MEQMGAAGGPGFEGEEGEGADADADADASKADAKVSSLG